MIEKITEADVSVDKMSRNVLNAVHATRIVGKDAVRNAYVNGYNDAVDAITQKMGEKLSESLTEREKGKAEMWGVVRWVFDMAYMTRQGIFGYESLEAIFQTFDEIELVKIYKEHHNEP